MEIANTLCFALLQVRTGVGRLARYPVSGSEILLCAVLVTIGLVLAIRLRRPLAQAIRALDAAGGGRRVSGGRFLERAALRGRDLRGCNLVNARLRAADLSDTDLRGTDLTGADPQDTILLHARYDAQTRWPEGFDPRKRGARRVE